MKQNVCIPIACALFAIFSSLHSLQAQRTPQELKTLILQKDSLFWAGYNNCDTTLTGQFLADDIEFFHDVGGITKGRGELNASLKKNLCSNPDRRLRREAVPGTVKFFPLKNRDTLYGAVLQGEHYFYIIQKGKKEFRDGHASFNHLWLLKEGAWKMERILSYDHHPAAYINTRKEIAVPVAVLRKYAGRYKGPQTNNLLIREEKGTLVMELAGKGTIPLFAETNNTFFMKERDLSFEFTRNGQQSVTGLRVQENGVVTEELTLQK
ncbi:DUF3471 domain-containing protein [Paraflavitalea speifideaquila]|uniref:nuclear transport factor 2 family protein n=1 Tax=Paraflavitalea speifideaquila TaxID=3076558 RepID=UPI0028ED6E21|nr:DUF3471 domain-containing protein [Paraflavitalea speifideiaquila]